MSCELLNIIFGSLLFAALNVAELDVDLRKTKIWGPGLKTDFFLPVRYFYIQAVSADGNNITSSIGDPGFSVSLASPIKLPVSTLMDILDRKDGLYIVRFRLIDSANDIEVSVTYKNQHVADSPYQLQGPAYSENCYCPERNQKKWLKQMNCPKSFKQINNDLSIFKDIDLGHVSRVVSNRYNATSEHGLCQYKIIDNQIYLKNCGQFQDFKHFMVATLLSITKKVQLPDLEFFMNHADWLGMLESKRRVRNPIPIFSWCGSDDAYDIVMPTYDITNSTMDMLERQIFDVFNVMGKSPTPWQNKTEIGFWRGRDSRQDRLDLVVLSRKHQERFDAKLTRMLKFKHEVEKYGELSRKISFFDFFKYKYLINMDGAVAAYRLPYLLAGDGVVLKQDSHYYEHFYKDLKPYVHYIPFKRDLSDLLEKIQWVKDNDEKAKEISQNGRNYVFERLTPRDIYCYHVKLFLEYSKRLKSPPEPPDDTWEIVKRPKATPACVCNKKVKKINNKDKDEL